MTLQQLIEKITKGELTELIDIKLILNAGCTFPSWEEYNSIPGKTSAEKAAHLLSEHRLKKETTIPSGTLREGDIVSISASYNKASKPLTAEEILKEHILQAACFDEDEYNERFENGEFKPELKAMRDFASQQNAELKAENKDLRNDLKELIYLTEKTRKEEKAYNQRISDRCEEQQKELESYRKRDRRCSNNHNTKPMSNNKTPLEEAEYTLTAPIIEFENSDNVLKINCPDEDNEFVFRIRKGKTYASYLVDFFEAGKIIKYLNYHMDQAKDHFPVRQQQNRVDVEEIEYSIRSILELHLNRFYLENGLSVPSKLRQDAEDKIIKEILPRLQQPQGDGWISVEDRLPDNKQVVHCYGNAYTLGKDMQVYRARFYKGDEHNLECFVHGPVTLKDVTHWQPLPQPPKQKEGEGE